MRFFQSDNWIQAWEALVRDIEQYMAHVECIRLKQEVEDLEAHM